MEGKVVFAKDFVHLSVGVRLELITSRAKRAFRKKITYNKNVLVNLPLPTVLCGDMFF